MDFEAQSSRRSKFLTLALTSDEKRVDGWVGLVVEAGVALKISLGLAKGLKVEQTMGLVSTLHWDDAAGVGAEAGAEVEVENGVRVGCWTRTYRTKLLSFGLWLWAPKFKVKNLAYGLIYKM